MLTNSRALHLSKSHEIKCTLAKLHEWPPNSTNSNQETALIRTMVPDHFHFDMYCLVTTILLQWQKMKCRRFIEKVFPVGFGFESKWQDKKDVCDSNMYCFSTPNFKELFKENMHTHVSDKLVLTLVLSFKVSKSVVNVQWNMLPTNS